MFSCRTGIGGSPASEGKAYPIPLAVLVLGHCLPKGTPPKIPTRSLLDHSQGWHQSFMEPHCHATGTPFLPNVGLAVHILFMFSSKHRALSHWLKDSGPLFLAHWQPMKVSRGFNSAPFSSQNIFPSLMSEKETRGSCPYCVHTGTHPLAISLSMCWARQQTAGGAHDGSSLCPQELSLG